MPKDSTPDPAIAQRLQAWRKAQNLSAEALGKRLGLSSNAWSHYEVGKSLPQAGKLAKLAQLFPIDLNYILTGKATLPAAPDPQEHLSWAIQALQSAVRAQVTNPTSQVTSHQPPTQVTNYKPTVTNYKPLAWPTVPKVISKTRRT